MLNINLTLQLQSGFEMNRPGELVHFGVGEGEPLAHQILQGVFK